jgi:acyl-coenzyme A thioesterase PaaI-like protein
MAMSHPGKAILAALPFNKHVGLSVDVVEEGHGLVTLLDRPEIHNHIGTPHAGALFTAAEAASGAAILGAFAENLGELTPLALNARIEYLKVAKGNITAEATMRGTKAEALVEFAKAEKGVNVEVDVSLKDATGREVTKMQVTWYLRKNR